MKTLVYNLRNTTAQAAGCAKVNGFAKLLITLTLLLTLSMGQMGAETYQEKETAEQNTTYIITPNISTQDTIYIKHEEANLTSNSWWDIYGNSILAIVTLLLGAGITWFTSLLTRKQERSYEKQEKIINEALQTEKEIYFKMIEIKNADNLEQTQTLLAEFKLQLQKARLAMRPELRATARDFFTHFHNIALDPQTSRNTEKEEEILEKYYELYKQA